MSHHGMSSLGQDQPSSLSHDHVVSQQHMSVPRTVPGRRRVTPQGYPAMPKPVIMEQSVVSHKPTPESVMSHQATVKPSPQPPIGTPAGHSHHGMHQSGGATYQATSQSQPVTPRASQSCLVTPRRVNHFQLPTPKVTHRPQPVTPKVVRHSKPVISPSVHHYQPVISSGDGNPQLNTSQVISQYEPAVHSTASHLPAVTPHVVDPHQVAALHNMSEPHSLLSQDLPHSYPAVPKLMDQLYTIMPQSVAHPAVDSYPVMPSMSSSMTSVHPQSLGKEGYGQFGQTVSSATMPSRPSTVTPVYPQSTSMLSGGGFGKPSHTVSSGDRLPAGDKVKPPPYNGSSSWEDFKSQFETMATISGWDYRTKCLQLTACLRGPAQAVLSGISVEQRCNFDSVMTALTQRFGSEDRTALFQAEFRNRRRNKNEKLPELAHDLRRLARLANPDAPSNVQEDLAMEQFIVALDDGDSRWRIRQTQPKTMNDVLRTALELEAHLESEHQDARSRKFVRAVTMTKHEGSKDAESSGSLRHVEMQEQPPDKQKSPSSRQLVTAG